MNCYWQTHTPYSSINNPFTTLQETEPHVRNYIKFYVNDQALQNSRPLTTMKYNVAKYFINKFRHHTNTSNTAMQLFLVNYTN